MCSPELSRENYHMNRIVKRTVFDKLFTGNIILNISNELKTLVFLLAITLNLSYNVNISRKLSASFMATFTSTV